MGAKGPMEGDGVSTGIPKPSIRCLLSQFSGAQISCFTVFQCYHAVMKTTLAQQVPFQWAEILTWLAADEEVQLTADDRVVARIVPAHPAPATANIASPDFLARAQAIWGQNPTGELLSALVTDSRGGGV